MVWPLPPAGFVYYLQSATINVVGAAGPVLMIAPGTIVKSWFSHFEIASGSQPGGLVANGVTFTSVYDDDGGDTDGSAIAPAAANWHRMDFNAAARTDSCLITNCEIRYGGNGGGVVLVDDSDPTVSGCTFTENAGSLYVYSSPGSAASLVGNTVNQGASMPIATNIDCLDNLVFGNTIVPRGDDVYNAIRLFNSTVTESYTLPVPPHGFNYYMSSATINVAGASGPVLTLSPGLIIKSWFSHFEIASATQPGGLVADGVTFTSARDDVNGDTDGTTLAPAAANWYRLDFNAQARTDSCLITNCEIRYGGNGPGALQVWGSDPTVSGCTFTDNNGSLYVYSSPGSAASLVGNTVNQGANLPVGSDIDCLDNVVFGNTIVPRGDDVYNGVRLFNSTVTSSTTIPALPHDFVYFLSSTTVNVAGPGGPVLTIAPGSIVKSWFSRFEIGSATVAGGLIAEDVLFTSTRDDEGGNTDNSTLAPSPGNWHRIDFNAAARRDSCRLVRCELRYGGNGGSLVETNNSKPILRQCWLHDSSDAAVYTHGADALPTLWLCNMTDNDIGLRSTHGGLARIVRCCYARNASYGVQVEPHVDLVGSLPSTSCWWGAVDGPSGIGPGSGDAVSDFVLYDPWYTTEACADLTHAPGDLLPERLEVAGAHPNPFNPGTRILFALPAKLPVTVDVYDAEGRHVVRLADEVMSAGPQSCDWHGRDDTGRRTPAGLYLYRVKAGGESRTGKMMLVR